MLIEFGEPVDIGLFTDANHGSIDFGALDQYLLNTFSFVKGNIGSLPGFGRAKYWEFIKDDGPPHQMGRIIFYTSIRGQCFSNRLVIN